VSLVVLGFGPYFGFRASNFLNEKRVFVQGTAKADNHNRDPSVLSRHSGMPLAGIHSGVFLDSGQNRAGMTEG
jgi:hypothetical protein